jgi:hypothetical protein
MEDYFMTYKDSAMFKFAGEYNDETGNIEGGKTLKLTGLEIHTIKDGDIREKYGAGRAVVKVRTSRGVDLPQNATMLWRGAEWQPVDSTAYHAQQFDSQRHWRSMRYIEVGGGLKDGN